MVDFNYCLGDFTHWDEIIQNSIVSSIRPVFIIYMLIDFAATKGQEKSTRELCYMLKSSINYQNFLVGRIIN